MTTTTRARTQRTATTRTAVAGGTFLWAVDYADHNGTWSPLGHDVEKATTAPRLANAIADRYQVKRPRTGRRRVRVWTWVDVLPPTRAELAAYAASHTAAAAIETALDEPTPCDLGEHQPLDPDEDGIIRCGSCPDILDTLEVTP